MPSEPPREQHCLCVQARGLPALPRDRWARRPLPVQLPGPQIQDNGTVRGGGDRRDWGLGGLGTRWLGVDVQGGGPEIRQEPQEGVALGRETD